MKTENLIDFNPLNACQGHAMSTGYTAEQMAAEGPKVSAYQEGLKPLLADLPALRKSNQAWFHVFKLPEVNIEKVIQVGEEVRQNFKDVVILGIGGSDFGPRALFDMFLGSDDYNNLYPNQRGVDDKLSPNIHFFQSFDSRKCRNFLNREGLDLTQTAFIVISKSGKTLETRRNFEFFRKKLIESLNNKGLDPASHKDHFVLVTDEAIDDNGHPKSVLLQEFWDVPQQKSTARALFPVPDGVGGRYSVFSPVGLVPAAVMGINIKEILKGLEEGFNISQLPSENKDNLAVQLATYQYLALQEGRNIQYFYAFGEVFKYLVKWYEQLVEESIGKRFTNKKGEAIATDLIVKPTVGTTDNHSFVQNLLGGTPKDKFVVFLGAADYARSEDITGDDGVHFDDNLQATLEGTREAVCDEAIPNVSLTLPKFAEREIAQLMFLLEASIAYLGEALLELEGNTFLQPDVEKYKIKTMEALKKFSLKATV